MRCSCIVNATPPLFLAQPTFGGINLEDIKAPECFYIEPRLQVTKHPCHFWAVVTHVPSLSLSSEPVLQTRRRPAAVKRNLAIFMVITTNAFKFI